nr:histone-lysine N-methyltransferase, H3 lysine-36 specific [Aspergillus niger CBS 513.88]|eukprot:XP_001398411.2 histone-lysine N-methyltransferase, H3 lysine-36 specific [Aspergillus niger CBS 513.88]
MSPHDYADRQSESVADAVTAMKLESDAAPENSAMPNGGGAMIKDESSNAASNASPVPTPKAERSRSSSRAPVKKEENYEDDGSNLKGAENNHGGNVEEKVGGDIIVKLEPGQPPKLTRSSSQKVVPRPPQLFAHLPDSTAEAQATFDLMDACTYANKYMGYTEHAMECDCAEEWEPSVSKNLACGEDSDCINRATKIECMGDCGCGPECQNQRFQRREYAPVAVIKTEKKGFGLRAEADLRPHQFIFEYVGEVINEGQFRRRMRQYDEEGIKHFYFMSLSKGEFVDATKKGNLGRFCNHSCNPNCYVDKWVVGEKLRMGIFAERHIQAGEELVFNYNVDRYGADPQPCYCGEPNCTGFIGGRTQTERATKLSNATIEALGIDDADGWDTAVAKRPRKKKTGEDDEEYVDSVQPKSLEENGVTKVMAALMQCKEKWIAVKLLGRIQRCDDERVRNRVVKMHGYQILNSQLGMWKEDHNVVLQILDILDKFPRLTRNKIIDSKIESTIQPLTSCGDERVEKKSATLLQVWSTLEPAPQPPPAPKESRDKALQDIIDGIMNAKENTPKEKSGTPATPQASRPTPDMKDGQEKWRSYSEEKRKKIYENTLYPHVKYVVDKFKHKLPKDDLKRYAKDVAKKLVNSDFKNNRVGDPTKIDDKQQKKVKKFCKEFFDKAVAKHRAYEQRKAERQSKEPDSKPNDAAAEVVEDDGPDMKMSDDEDDRVTAQDGETPTTMTEDLQGHLKRKREDEPSIGDGSMTEYTTPSSSKRQRSSTPPPPPPPPMSPGNEQGQSGEDGNMKSDTDEPTPADKQDLDSPPPPPPPPPYPGQEMDTNNDHFNPEDGVKELNPSQIGIEGRV